MECVCVCGGTSIWLLRRSLHSVQGVQGGPFSPSCSEPATVAIAWQARSLESKGVTPPRPLACPNPAARSPRARRLPLAKAPILPGEIKGRESSLSSLRFFSSSHELLSFLHLLVAAWSVLIVLQVKWSRMRKGKAVRKSCWQHATTTSSHTHGETLWLFSRSGK